MLRRTGLRRSPWRRRKGLRRRPGTFPPSGSGWVAQAERVRSRDRWSCRYCGVVGAAIVDHVIPRRLLPDSARDQDEALCTLCPRCHGKWKRLVEDRLFRRGEALALYDWLGVIRGTGPIPDAPLLAAAFARLRALRSPGGPA